MILILIKDLGYMNKLVKVPVIVSIMMLFIGFFEDFEDPKGYYTLLRIVVFLTSVYLTLFAFYINRKIWGWIFCFCLILFNPFVPVYFEKRIWLGIDPAVAITMFIFLIINSGFMNKVVHNFFKIFTFLKEKIRSLPTLSLAFKNSAVLVYLIYFLTGIIISIVAYSFVGK